MHVESWILNLISAQNTIIIKHQVEGLKHGNHSSSVTHTVVMFLKRKIQMSTQE